MRALDLRGLKFDRLLVVEMVGASKKGNRWLCKCDCGQVKVVTAGLLSKRAGKNQACDACRGEAIARANTKHGFAAKWNAKRLYRIWGGMVFRCENKKAVEYPRYGGKGISVCHEWRTDFSVFKDWAISHGYTDALTIDRVNPELGYDPTNCEWVPKSVNSWRANHPELSWRSMTCDMVRVDFSEVTSG